MPRTSVVLFLSLWLAAGAAHGQGFWGQQGGQSSGQGSWGRGWGDQQPQQRRFYRPPAKAAPAPAPEKQEAQPQPQNRPVPYDRDLQRLAEILGSLHFLRGICGSSEGQKWRDEAQMLIDTEAPGGERHEQMIASFNRGYRAFQQSYRACTPAADFAIRRYLAEGAKIAREITARYAN
jgi:uncharacterized protein (TIGR02301 family)